jgi:hypothetical protein
VPTVTRTYVPKLRTLLELRCVCLIFPALRDRNVRSSDTAREMCTLSQYLRNNCLLRFWGITHVIEYVKYVLPYVNIFCVTRDML